MPLITKTQGHMDSLKLTEGVTHNSRDEKRIIQDILGGITGKEFVKRYKKKSKRFVYDEASGIVKLMEQYRDVWDRNEEQRDKILFMMKRLDTFARTGRGAMTGRPILYNGVAINEEHPGQTPAPATALATTASTTPVPSAIDTAKTTINAMYSQFLNDDPKAVDALLNYAGQSRDHAKLVKEVINSRHHFQYDSPVNVKTASLDEFKNHFNTLAYLDGLTHTVGGDDRQKGGDAYSKYVKRHDPTGKRWIVASGLLPLLKTNNKFKMKNLKKKDYMHALHVIDKRRALFGMEPLKPGKLTIPNIKSVLKDLDLTDLFNVYKKFPQLERPDTEAREAKYIAEEEKAVAEGDITGLLTGESKEERGKKIKLRAQTKMATADIMSIKDGKVMYTPSDYKANIASGADIADTITKIVADHTVHAKITEELKTLKDDEKFKQNEPVSRKNILHERVKTVDPGEMGKSIKQLKDDGFMDEVFLSVYGKTKQPTVIALERAIQSIASLPPNKLEDIRHIIRYYSDNNVPAMQAEFDDVMGKTVGASPDLRRLPKGVKIDASEVKAVETATAEAKTEKAMRIKRLGEITKEKKKAGTEAKMNALLVEEAKLKADAKSSKQYDVKSTSESKTIRAGSLRPHFSNPTESAVEQALGKSPEQQMQDFSNWYTFDIPSDQTGQGSARVNPFVKQNEERESFMGGGDIWSAFNTTYQLTDGVEERKMFYTQHAKLMRSAVRRGLITRKIESEEQRFLKRFDTGSNGLFAQDQTRGEMSNFKDMYQKPNDFFRGTTYPFQDTANTSLRVTDFDKNLNYFVEP